MKFTAEKDYASAQMRYRRVNQVERWNSVPMESSGRLWSGAIPSEYTQSPYPLQYYFELTETPESAVLYPGLSDRFTGQPYFVVRR